MNHAPQPRVIRRYELEHPTPLVVEFHDSDCTCIVCEPYVPSIAPALTAPDLSWLTLVGVAVGLVIIFTIDPAGAAAALADCLHWWLL